ncbi:Sir2 histone deacetylase Hst2 [Puccinia graminis f. sp. tritici]|uniref:Sir2 histone deacetylase Hst2 n=1 Tax=Puccinia graminis f. sp. tritici TaxID=56615 RepID=A0A5B0SE55_PUCGR|nr:Sir2 histone deacetylase Hst2 [Puccinia graminis f. sp. tritici]
MRFKRQDLKIRRRVFDGLDGKRLANLDDVATLIKSGRVENIIIMVGHIDSLILNPTCVVVLIDKFLFFLVTRLEQGSRRALVSLIFVHQRLGSMQTFFGEQLPKKFFGSLTDFQEADLLIVLGTSLQVQPFASLISTVPINCPRLLINLEKVGDIGHRGGGADQGGFDFEGIQRGGKEFIRDVLVLGTTDDGVEELCDLLGWKDQLLDLYDPSRKIQTHGKSLSSTNQKDEPEIEADGGKDQMEGEVLDPEDIKGQAHRDTRSPVLDATSSSSSQANPTSPERRGSQKLPAKLPTQVDTAQPQANPQENQKPEDHVDQLAATVTHLSLSENL